MRNVCPHCGKVIEAGQQAFDLTEFLGSQMKRYLQSNIFPKAEIGNQRLYIQGMEKFFNSMKQEYPLVFTENELWNMPSVEPESPSIVKTILLRFPYLRVKEQMKTFLGTRDDVLEQTYSWYSNKSSFIG